MSSSLGDTPTISGHLGTIGVQDVLGFLANLRHAGALEVESPDGEITLYLNGGEVVGGHVARGGESGVDDLASALSSNILRLCTWTPGAFRFYEGRTPPPEVEPVRIEVCGLLLEAARRCEDLALLPDLYTDPATRFELLAEPRRDESICMTLAEWQLLYQVKGRRTLGEIWEKSALGSHLETSRTLFGFVSARLIQPLGEDAKEPAPTPPYGLKIPERLAPAIVRSAAEEVPGACLPDEPSDTQPVLAPPGDLRKLCAADAATAVPARPLPEERLRRSQVRIRRTGRLVELVPEGSEREIPLTGEATTLGRSADNDLILPDGHVSGHHARIARDGDEFMIEDCRSSNGIRVDRRPVFRTNLDGGEEIEIYPYRFRFEISFEVFAAGKR